MLLLSKYTCNVPSKKKWEFSFGFFFFCSCPKASLQALFRKISNSVTQTFLFSFISSNFCFSLSLFFCVSCLVYCRQSIKSSFRDKDKPSRFKDLQTTTRFQVEPQNEESDDDSHDSQEDRELLNDNEYDTKYGKSFRSV